MKRDVMQAAGLETFAEAAIILFFVAFGAIALWTFLSRRGWAENAARLPLDDGVEVSP